MQQIANLYTPLKREWVQLPHPPQSVRIGLP